MWQAPQWHARQRCEDYERGRLNAAFPTTPKGWSKRTPQPVWHKPEWRCQMVFDGYGLRLIVACPIKSTPEGSIDTENEILVMTLIGIDGSSPNEALRTAFRQAFFPNVGKALQAQGRSPTGVFTYHLATSVLV